MLKILVKDVSRRRTYRKVNAIYLIKDGETKNLKYSYLNIVQELTELHISFKYVW